MHLAAMITKGTQSERVPCLAQDTRLLVSDKGGLEQARMKEQGENDPPREEKRPQSVRWWHCLLGLWNFG